MTVREKVYVIAPGIVEIELPPVAHICSPRLADAAQADSFKMDVTDERADAVTSPGLPEWFIKRVRQREASISIGASTARGMGEGTVKAARSFLHDLDLRRLVTDSEETFQRSLDAATVRCQGTLPSQSWGAARKFLNIYLRGAFYNRFLYDHYGLAIIESFLEVPLDKSVAVGLRGEEGGSSLPPWGTIIRLKPDVSAIYQGFAREVARKKGCARVHLDLWYFRNDSEQ